jgi:methionyl-tRNA formyltransferase
MLDGVNEILVNAVNGTAQSKQQDESKAKWHSKPSLKDVLVNWKVMPAAEICALVRACNNWNAGAITLYQGMELKLIDASFVPNNSTELAGTITAITDSVKISCADGNELSIHYLSLNGIPIPGRYAKQYGIFEGERLTYPSD